MGKSRSATILAAYLMATRRIAPNLALGLIERARPIVEPNPGFMKQLELYHEMNYTDVVEDHPLYQRWIYLQDVEMSNAAGRAPERVHFRDAEAAIGKITQVKEGETPAEKGEIELRCKKCRCAHIFIFYFPSMLG
jgi:dual specificity phosphatase 12